MLLEPGPQPDSTKPKSQQLGRSLHWSATQYGAEEQQVVLVVQLPPKAVHPLPPDPPAATQVPFVQVSALSQQGMPGQPLTPLGVQSPQRFAMQMPEQHSVASLQAPLFGRQQRPPLQFRPPQQPFEAVFGQERSR